MESTKDNPLSLGKLIELVKDELPPHPGKQPKYHKYKKKMSYNEYQGKILGPWKHQWNNWWKALSKYSAGTYKEWEGDGYYNSPLFYYKGEYYG